MPIYHATLKFASPSAGWVEQFFRSDSGLQSALTAAVYLAQARFQLLGGGINLYEVRVSQVGPPRVTVSAKIYGTPQPVLPMRDNECPRFPSQGVVGASTAATTSSGACRPGQSSRAVDGPTTAPRGVPGSPAGCSC